MLRKQTWAITVFFHGTIKNSFLTSAMSHNNSVFLITTGPLKYSRNFFFVNSKLYCLYVGDFRSIWTWQCHAVKYNLNLKTWLTIFDKKKNNYIIFLPSHLDAFCKTLHTIKGGGIFRTLNEVKFSDNTKILANLLFLWQHDLFSKNFLQSIFGMISSVVLTAQVTQT